MSTFVSLNEEKNFKNWVVLIVLVHDVYSFTIITLFFQLKSYHFLRPKKCSDSMAIFNTDDPRMNVLRSVKISTLSRLYIQNWEKLQIFDNKKLEKFVDNRIFHRFYRNFKLCYITFIRIMYTWQWILEIF